MELAWLQRLADHFQKDVKVFVGHDVGRVTNVPDALQFVPFELSLQKFIQILTNHDLCRAVELAKDIPDKLLFFERLRYCIPVEQPHHPFEFGWDARFAFFTAFGHWICGASR